MERGPSLGGWGRRGLYIFYWICLSGGNLFAYTFLGNYRDFVGKNKTINITNKEKGKERIVEKVVTGSVREIFGKNEADKSRN